MKNNWFIINFNHKKFLRAGNKIFECQVGSKGLNSPFKKIEGDKTTPTGKWYLNDLYYRSDRILRPKLKKKKILKINLITKDCGWCDDIRSHHYNKYIKVKKTNSQKFKYESLWREDDAYDILITISYNRAPRFKNKGSAIFIHCSFQDNRNTAGCIALKKKNLIFLIKTLRDKTYIKI